MHSTSYKLTQHNERTKYDTFVTDKFIKQLTSIEASFDKSAKQPTPARFLCLVTLTFDLLTPKSMKTHRETFLFSVSSLVILAAPVF